MSQNYKVVAVILAAGSSSRYHTSPNNSEEQLPKQFSDLAGKPLISYSLETFAASKMVDAIVVVLPADDIEVFTQDIYTKLSSDAQDKLQDPVAGGDSRLASAVNGLARIKELADDDCLVAVHDAARPLVSIKSIEECIKAASSADGAVLATPLTDSLGYVDDTFVDDASDSKLPAKHIAKNIPRAGYYAMQTPQVFKAGLLGEAYQSVLHSGLHSVSGQNDLSKFTDESSIVLAYDASLKVSLVEGDANNIKLTYPADKYKLEAILQSASNNSNSSHSPDE